MCLSQTCTTQTAFLCSQQRSASESAIQRYSGSPSRSKDGRQRKHRAQTRLSRSATPPPASNDGNGDADHRTEGGDGMET